MHRPIDSSALAEASAVLEGLSGVVTSAEDSLLSCLVVMGEPDAQAAVDGWIDQVVDLLRAVDQVTEQHQSTLARSSTRIGDRGSVERDTNPLPRHALTHPADQP